MSFVLSSEALRTSREAARLSRPQVAAALGCSVSAVQSWERGWKQPKAADVANLAALYDVQMASLFVHERDAATPADAGAESTSGNPHGGAAAAATRSRAPAHAGG